MEKMAEENCNVRNTRGRKKIIGKERKFYDKEKLKNLTPNGQKATRVLTNTLQTG
jgi:hypothetical protein